MPESNRTVLLVEDNEDNLVIYSTILRHAGYSVLEARDGEAGIETAQREHPALILMDVSIPLVDGWEATRRLKADPATKSIPIIALTAHALPADRAKADEAGCDGYIPKPAEPRVVLAAVKQYLGEPAAV
jgi:two-component system cell cycle response regulator DivK